MRVRGTAMVESVVDVLCDVCGRSTITEGGPEYGTLEAHWGFGSAKHDGERYRVDLCEACFFGALGSLRRQRMVQGLYTEEEPTDHSKFGLISRGDASSEFAPALPADFVDNIHKGLRELKAGAVQPYEFGTSSGEQRSGSPAGGALRTFFSIAERWGLDDKDCQILLAVSCSDLLSWRSDPDDARLTQATLERLSYIFNIWADLQVVLPEEYAADSWLRRPNDHPLFEGQTPLDWIRGGHGNDLQRVAQYTRSWSGTAG